MCGDIPAARRNVYATGEFNPARMMSSLAPRRPVTFADRYPTCGLNHAVEEMMPKQVREIPHSSGMGIHIGTCGGAWRFSIERQYHCRHHTQSLNSARRLRVVEKAGDITGFGRRLDIRGGMSDLQHVHLADGGFTKWRSVAFISRKDMDLRSTNREIIYGGRLFVYGAAWLYQPPIAMVSISDASIAPYNGVTF